MLNEVPLRTQGHTCHSGWAFRSHSWCLRGPWVPGGLQMCDSVRPRDADVNRDPAGCIVWTQGKPKCMTVTPCFTVGKNKLQIFGNQTIKRTHLKHSHSFPLSTAFAPLLGIWFTKFPGFRFHSGIYICIYEYILFL